MSRPAPPLDHPPAAAPSVAFDGVTHRFGDHVALHDIDVTLTERRVGIVGGNGSGKSTFARLINGLLLPTAGVVRVGGRDTRREGRAVRAEVGFVFQNPDHQIVYPTVAEDIAFGLSAQKLRPAETAARVAAVLDRFGLGALRDRSAHLLSGGEKQLVAIAGVLIMQPSLIVFDEPTTLLDLRNTRRIAAVIAGLAQSAIVVSHDLEMLRDCDRVLVFEDGRIVADDVPGPALARYVASMASAGP